MTVRTKNRGRRNILRKLLILTLGIAAGIASGIYARSTAPASTRTGLPQIRVLAKNLGIARHKIVQRTVARPEDVVFTGSIPKPAPGGITVIRRSKGDRLKTASKNVNVKLGGPFAESTSELMFSTANRVPNAWRRFKTTIKKTKPKLPVKSMTAAKFGPRLLTGGRAFGGLTESQFQNRERRCLATALYFEARGEPLRGRQAVAQVIMNRVRSAAYPDTICGVIFQGSYRRTGCQFSFACDGRTDRPNNSEQWALAKKLATQVTNGKVWLNDISWATHYHASYVKPVWRKQMRRIKQIGRHIFYKSPKISVTRAWLEKSPKS